MFAHYWGAIGLALALASYPVLAQQGPAKNGPSVEVVGANGAQNQQDPAFPVTIVETPDQAKHADAREASSDQHDAEDLKAQRSAADAALRSAVTSEWQVRLSWAQIAIALLGTGALLYSLLLSRQATTAAIAAAAAARDAIGVERAWLMFQGVHQAMHTAPIIDGVQYPLGLEVLAQFSNMGRTPALKVNTFRDVKVIGLHDPIPTFVPPASFVDGLGVVGPGEQPFAAAHVIVGAEYDAFMNKSSRAVIYLRTTYVDTFQPHIQRVTETCCVTRFMGTGIGPDGQQFPRFETMIVGVQNTAT